MKKKSILIPFVLGLVFLASCSKTKKPTKITEATTTTEETTQQGSSSITQGGEYDDGEDWGELHS